MKQIVFDSKATQEEIKRKLASVSEQNGFYPIYSSSQYYELGQNTSKFPDWVTILFYYNNSVFYVTSEGERKVIDDGKIVIDSVEIRGTAVSSMTLSVKRGLRLSTMNSSVGTQNASLSDIFHFTDSDERHSEMSPDSHSWQGGMRLAYEGDAQLKKHDKDIEDLQRQAFGSGIFEYSGELPSENANEFFDKYAFVVNDGVCYVRSSFSEGKAIYSSNGDLKSNILVYDGSSVSFREKILSKIEATPVDIVW